jgi:hypothetical protein
MVRACHWIEFCQEISIIPQPAHRQHRIVGPRRAGAHQHRVVAGAQRMHLRRRLGPVIQRLSPAPWRCARRGCQASFSVTIGPARASAAGNPACSLAARRGRRPRHLDPGRAQHRMAAPETRGSGSVSG